MTDEQLGQIKKTIADSIETNVNGKIRALDQKLDDYIVADNKWKQDADPYIKGLANVTGGAKIFVWVFAGISTVAGAIASVIWGIRQLFINK